MGDGLGRSCGSSFVCFVSMIAARAKMDKAKDFSCDPVLGQPSPRDVGGPKGRSLTCLREAGEMGYCVVSSSCQPGTMVNAGISD